MKAHHVILILGLALMAVIARGPESSHAVSFSPVMQGAPCPIGTTGATQTVAAGGSSTATATVIGNNAVRMMCTTTTHVVEGTPGQTGPVATSSSMPLAPLTPEYFYSKSSAQYYGFIADSSAGTCYVTECK